MIVKYFESLTLEDWSHVSTIGRLIFVVIVFWFGYGVNKKLAELKRRHLYKKRFGAHIKKINDVLEHVNTELNSNAPNLESIRTWYLEMLPEITSLQNKIPSGDISKKVNKMAKVLSRYQSIRLANEPDWLKPVLIFLAEYGLWNHQYLKNIHSCRNRMNVLRGDLLHQHKDFFEDLK